MLSFPLLQAVVPNAAASTTLPLFAFVLGAALAGSVPPVRDAVLPLVETGRVVGVVLVLAVALVSGAGLDVRSAAIAASLAASGVVVAAASARIFGGDPIGAAIGGGTRDPAFAAGIALTAGVSPGVSVAYAALALAGLGLWRLVRRKA